MAEEKVKELLARKREIKRQIDELSALGEKGVKWEEIQPRIEELEGELRRIDREIVDVASGVDRIKMLEDERARLLEKLAKAKEMYKKGEISKEIYKEMKERLENEIKETEREIAELKLLS